MGRSTNSVRAERINAALELLQQCKSRATAARAMVEAYGMSTRQAYRYLQEAQTQQEPLPIPQRKVAFTVKLSPVIIDEVHQQSRRHDQSLSQLVEQALQSYLHREGSSG